MYYNSKIITFGFDLAYIELSGKEVSSMLKRWMIPEIVHCCEGHK